MPLGPRVVSSPAAAPALRSELFGVLAILRLLLAAYVVQLDVSRLDQFQRPGLAMGVVGVVVVWSLVAVVAYRTPWRDTWALQLTDLGLVAGLMLLSLATHSDAMRAAHAPTLVSFWSCVPVLAIAASRGALPAAGAALVVAAADLTTRVDLDAGVIRTLLLLLVAAVMVGHGSRLIDRTAAAEVAAEAQRSAFAERTRVYRDIHDGVLQALALSGRIADAHRDVHPDLAALAVEARSQERTLRRLMQDADRGTTFPEHDGPDPIDLVPALAELASAPHVELATPAHPCPVPGAVATELLAAAREALANVEQHCPPGTSAWLFLEWCPEACVLSIRDDGPGIPSGRLARAVDDGHRGVAHSIEGRLHDLGGEARLHTGPDGTEWELSVPLPQEAP